MNAAKAHALLDSLIDRGFDNSEIASADYTDDVDPSDQEFAIQIGCSQCEALAVNGHATHEHGCPNGRRYKCHECGQDHRTAEEAGECCAPVYEEEEEDDDATE
jgi:transposase-like protein